MKTYNRHRSWNAWNVALWISNDEPLYRLAVELFRRYPTATCAARHMIRGLPARTPDGAVYNLSSVRSAIIGLEIQK